jgi:flagellar biosynthetic protein FliQ
MTPESVMTMGRTAMEITLLVSAPLLLVALVVGLVVSIFQAATQINEQTLSFLPRLLVTLVALILAGHWMTGYLMDYCVSVFQRAATLAS